MTRRPASSRIDRMRAEQCYIEEQRCKRLQMAQRPGRVAEWLYNETGNRSLRMSHIVALPARAIITRNGSAVIIPVTWPDRGRLAVEPRG